jgi:hypothetical protein
VLKEIKYAVEVGLAVLICGWLPYAACVQALRRLFGFQLNADQICAFTAGTAGNQGVGTLQMDAFSHLFGVPVDFTAVNHGHIVVDRH